MGGKVAVTAADESKIIPKECFVLIIFVVEELVVEVVYLLLLFFSSCYVVLFYIKGKLIVENKTKKTSNATPKKVNCIKILEGTVILDEEAPRYSK